MKTNETPSTLESFTVEKKQAFYELLTNTSPKTQVFVEEHDDVSVEEDNYKKLIQSKSATSKNNQPLSDMSVDLWKTLSNWVDKCSNFQGAHKYVLSVSSQQNILTGNIVDSFNTATSLNNALQAYEAAKLEVKIRERRGSVYRNNFFNPINKTHAIHIIERFSFEIHIGFNEELFTLLVEKNLIPSENQEHMFDLAIGWINNRITEFTEKGQAARLLRKDFRDYLTAELSRLKSAPLAKTIEEPDGATLRTEQLRNPIYVRQLRLIGIDESQEDSNDILDAISNYLSAETQIAKWAERGRITPEGREDYHDALFDNWKDERRALQYEPIDPLFFGKKLFTNSRRESKRILFQGMHTPYFVGPGTLHYLASHPNEEPKIGWHPNYVEKLSNYESGVDGD